VVDNLDNGSELAGVGTAADQHDTANLNQLPLGNRDIDIGHGEGFLYGDKHSVSETFFSAGETAISQRTG
jgi:hypothetical protein